MQLQMHEAQSHSTLRTNGHVQFSILVVEIGLPSVEVCIQVHHERQLTLFACISTKVAVEVRGEFLLRIVSVKTKPFVEADGVPFVNTFW
jgi:hypothetical protein